MIDLPKPLALDRPPAGWLVLRGLDELPRLQDDRVSAATLLPADPAAAAFFCENLHSICTDPTWQDSQRSTTDLSYHCTVGDRIDRYRTRQAALLETSALAADPRWQIARDEFLNLGDALALLFLTPKGGRHLNAHLACWHSFATTGKLHTDNHPRHPLPLVATLCRRPTVVCLDGQSWQGPDYSYTFFKASRTLHRADTTEPHRPRVQAVYDLVEERASPLL